ncbi:LysR family transcriptional regulator [Hoeflea olei]|uniref:LysR family transcriptional regulator n=1 Tax=Hoeflea olei TaxID=1480615 RepID=A0A1C1YW17_9HYPH|nr:LysR family transcriptional regulator [Hoeflea olei]OCW57691.1 LysR family transcriptional regulator [Hoeflea olei]
MENLGTLAAFVQAAESGSFSAAGQRLGLSSSAIGKAVGRLEEDLGVRLFQRDTRRMSLTEEGRLLLDRARRIFEEVDGARSDLARTSADAKGRLRVSMPLVGMLLMPAIEAFWTAYPNIELDLDFSDRLVDLIEERIDVALRSGTPGDSRLMRRKLGSFRLKLVASPDYLERNGTPSSPADLAGHSCLRQRFVGSQTLHAWPLQPDVPDLPVAISASAIEPLLHLVRADKGIACLPPFAVDPAIAAGELRQILSDHMTGGTEMALVWPTARQLSPRARAFIDFMAQAIRFD